MQQAIVLPGAAPIGSPNQRPWPILAIRADTAYALAFILPYAAMFAALVVYPVAFGLWMGREPRLYSLLFGDRLYLTTMANTLLMVVIGVNVKMILALLLSGFFFGGGWGRKVLFGVFMLPWALPALTVFLSMHYMLVTQWGLLDSLWRSVIGQDGPLFLVSRDTAMAANIVAYVWKWLPFWTLVFLSARMAIPRYIYEAAAIDGASAFGCLWHVTLPLLSNIYLVSTLLSAVWTFGDFSTAYFVSSGAPARLSDVLATYGFRMAFDFGHPDVGVAAVMSALPIVVPIVVLLMRRIRRGGVQL